MTNPKDFSQFSFSFDPSLDMFEPGEPESMDDIAGADPGVFLPNTEGITEFLPPDPDRVPRIPNAVDHSAPEYAARPAEERTRELLAQMNPHRQVLLGVLRAAMQPRSTSQIKQAVDDLRAHKFSVYSPSNICTMLEVAGALERVTENGTPSVERKPKPNIVIIDGEEYYEPAAPITVYWQTTAAGQSALDANDPAARIERQLDREQEFACLYKRILVLCARDEGATMSQLSAAVDSDPLICEPRRFFVQHFAEALERCECIAWQGDAWKTTELGAQTLEEKLADISDDFPQGAAPSPDAAKGMPTETQGVCW